MILEEAKNIADDLCKQLQPFCDKINVAGSIRREKTEVKDIEIVCSPKIEILKDMFGWDEGIIRSIEFSQMVKGLGIIEKGKVDGKYMQIHLAEQGINLDLFMPDDFDYYRQFAVRTGSAAYTAKYIAGGWKRIGWCGSDVGLRKISDCTEHKILDDKSRWVCTNAEAELPPHWKSEEEFFSWLDLKWIHPTKRNL